MFFKIRAMRTKMNLDPGTGLVTQYSASQPDISYGSAWKCKVRNVLAGEKERTGVMCHMVAQYRNEQRSN